MKPKRKKLVIAEVENLLAKYERRIQKLAQNAYDLRKLLDVLRTTEKVIKEAETIGGTSDAICDTNSQGPIGTGTTDTNTGESELFNLKTPDTLLAEQPGKLSGD